MTAGRGPAMLRRLLVTAQAALSLVMAAEAALFVSTLHSLSTQKMGFDRSGVLIAEVGASLLHLPPQGVMELERELLSRLRATPGVTDVAAVAISPVSGYSNNEVIFPHNEVQPASAWENEVSAGYFATMRTDLIAGRDFNDGDSVTAPRVVVVNKAFAEKFFVGNAVGRSFGMRSDARKSEDFYRVVGVVENTKYDKLRSDFEPIFYLDDAQDPHPSPGFIFVVRSREAQSSLASAVRRALAQVNSRLVFGLTPLDRQIADSLVRERLMAVLSGVFGGLAALLAMLGLYGVMSYSVAQRRQEIGVRMALGADRAQIVGRVLREAGLLVGAGSLLGVGLALLAGRAASTLLYGVTPYDPLTLGAAVVGLMLTALMAASLPARRAARVDPMAALREE